MLRKLRPRSAYDVMAALALFLVVAGGSAYAVVAANQVNSSSIINGQVKTPDLGANSVGTGKIKPGGVRNSDLRANSVTGAKVAANALTGADVNESTLFGVNAARLGGVPSARFLRGLTSRDYQSTANSTAVKDRFLSCPSGTKVVGGGAGVFEVDSGGNQVLNDNINVNLVLSHSAPVITSTTQAWYARAVEADDVAANWFLDVDVICADDG